MTAFKVYYAIILENLQISVNYFKFSKIIRRKNYTTPVIGQCCVFGVRKYIINTR